MSLCVAIYCIRSTSGAPSLGLQTRGPWGSGLTTRMVAALRTRIPNGGPVLGRRVHDPGAPGLHMVGFLHEEGQQLGAAASPSIGGRATAEYAAAAAVVPTAACPSRVAGPAARALLKTNPPSHAAAAPFRRRVDLASPGYAIATGGEASTAESPARPPAATDTPADAKLRGLLCREKGMRRTRRRRCSRWRRCRPRPWRRPRKRRCRWRRRGRPRSMWGPTEGPVEGRTEGPTEGPMGGPTAGPVAGPAEGPTGGPRRWRRRPRPRWRRPRRRRSSACTPPDAGGYGPTWWRTRTSSRTTARQTRPCSPTFATCATSLHAPSMPFDRPRFSWPRDADTLADAACQRRRARAARARLRDPDPWCWE